MKSSHYPLTYFLSAFALAGSLTLVAPSLRAQAGTEKSASAGHAGFSVSDKKLIAAAAESDETEISAAKLALEKSSNAKIKEYAQMMIKDHTASTKMLKPIAEAAGLPQPELKPEHKEMAAKLAELSGSAFDQAYLAGNVKSHAEILATMQKAATVIANPELKEFSEKMMPIIEHHLMMAKEMEKAG